ncbi:phosphate-binding protein [Tyzzerella sp. An114]|uniref:phosphate ABC transporter substrate-binding protein n=1 Tax=Tyzzerella sp. An114 TaxID=1965545 RepID=UPI000B4439B8|nr:phosphate ABC transporter substrate-binding protein [Tyzzerella sp. An114]OUQ60106.1 phosphate-binding protein [Tyzzerella sp. An114]
MKKLIAGLCILAMAFSMTACGSSDTASDNGTAQETEQSGTEEGVTGTVSVVGSTTVQPVAQSIADEFASVEPGISVEVQGVGSSAGIKAAIDGTADIGASSRELKEEEKATGITEHVLAYDGIAVVVNTANPVKDLDSETVKKIFEGEITNWKEVGGNDEDIVVISRESGSGTRDAFEEMMELTEEVDGKAIPTLREDALICEGNGAVKASVASKTNSIAYLSLGYVDDTMNTVSIDGVAPTVETVKSGEYKISRPLLLVTNGEVSEATQKYLDYCLDEGQTIVSENYISIK